MVTNQLKGRPFPGVRLPAHLHDELEPVRTRRGNGRSELPNPYQVHYGTLFHAVVGDFAGEQFPEDHPEGPDVHFFGAGRLAQGFWRHPGDGARKTHLLANVVQRARRPEVANFDDFAFAYEHAAKEVY